MKKFIFCLIIGIIGVGCFLAINGDNLLKEYGELEDTSGYPTDDSIEFYYGAPISSKVKRLFTKKVFK